MTLDRLRREHGNIARLLLVLESHLAGVHAGDEFDARLMMDALSYLIEYVDRFHREREDIFVEALARHQPTVRSFLATLSAQHHAIETSGASLAAQLQQVIQDELVDRVDLVRDGFAYCTELRRSMSLEETILSFAMATVAPSPPRGEPLESRSTPPPAPELRSSIEDRYRRLFEELTCRIGCDCAYARSG